MTNIYQDEKEDEWSAFQQRIVKTVISCKKDNFVYASLEYFSSSRYKNKWITLVLIFLLILTIFSIMSFEQVFVIQAQDLSNLKMSENQIQNNGRFIQNQVEAVEAVEQDIIKLHRHIRSWPLDLHFTKLEGNSKQTDFVSVEQALYPNKAMQKWRRQFHQHRIEFINQNKHFQGLHLAKYNMILEPFSSKQFYEAKVDFDAEWERLENKFHLSSITEQLPMCVVVPSFNNNANFRIEYNLNSIFTQNYSNFKVVVVNDASNDKSEYVYHRYFDFYAIDPEHYVYIENIFKKNSLQNVYLAISKHCGKDSIVITVDGDDELIGRNVLKVLNWGYQTKKAGVLYSNFFFYYQPIEVKAGFTQQYTGEQKMSSSYRDIDMKFSHLKSFRAQLFLKIQPGDLKDEFGNFYKVVCDQAFFFAVMQMACGRVHKIQEEYQYLYSMGTGLNAYAKGDNLGKQVEERIRASKKYGCLRDFDDRMRLLE